MIGQYNRSAPATEPRSTSAAREKIAPNNFTSPGVSRPSISLRKDLPCLLPCHLTATVVAVSRRRSYAEYWSSDFPSRPGPRWARGGGGEGGGGGGAAARGEGERGGAVQGEAVQAEVER